MANFIESIGTTAWWIGFAVWYNYFAKGKQLPPIPPLPPIVPEDAPLTKEQQAFRFQRAPDKPNALVRRLWGEELFFWVFAKWTNNAADTAAVFHFTAPGVDVRKYARSAWLRVRFEAPLIGAKVVKGALPHLPAHLPYWQYDIPDSFDQVSAWADATFQMVEQEEGKSDAQVVDELRNDLMARPVSDDYPATGYLYIGKERNTFIFNSGHFLADGTAFLSVVDMFWQALAESADVDLNEQVRKLKWGSEVESLPPTVSEAMGFGPTCEDKQVMLQLIAPLIEGRLPSLTLVPHRDVLKGRLGTNAILQYKLDPTETKQINNAIKSLGFNFSHALDAARHTALYFIRAKIAEEADLPLEETHIVNFLSPINCRKFFRGKYADKPYVSVGCAAFNTEVPMAALARRPGQSDVEWQQHIFSTCLKVLAPQYIAVGNDWRLIQGVAPGTTLLGCEKPAVPSTEEPGLSDAYTSLGLLESKIKTDYTNAAGETVLSFSDFALSSRQTSCQVALHTWNVRGTTVFSANYNDRFDEDYIRNYLDIIVGVLREATRRVGLPALAAAAREMESPAAVSAAKEEVAERTVLTEDLKKKVEQAASQVGAASEAAA
ncbi:hypothetical protein OC861_004637 [Tilletia horrida]|nr:hypothetical protein OC861_004637 [Tilletia horrida]